MVWFKNINEVEYLDDNKSKYIYLCEDHFELRYFTNTLKSHLSSSAVPTIFRNTNSSSSVTIDNSANQPTSQFTHNSDERQNQPSTSHQVIIPTRKPTPLKLLNVKRVSQLSSRKKTLYMINRKQKVQICKLKCILKRARNKEKVALNVTGKEYNKKLFK